MCPRGPHLHPTSCWRVASGRVAVIGHVAFGIARGFTVWLGSSVAIGLACGLTAGVGRIALGQRAAGDPVSAARGRAADDGP